MKFNGGGGGGVKIKITPKKDYLWWDCRCIVVTWPSNLHSACRNDKVNIKPVVAEEEGMNSLSLSLSTTSKTTIITMPTKNKMFLFSLDLERVVLKKNSIQCHGCGSKGNTPELNEWKPTLTI